MCVYHLRCPHGEITLTLKGHYILEAIDLTRNNPVIKVTERDLLYIRFM